MSKTRNITLGSQAFSSDYKIITDFSCCLLYDGMMGPTREDFAIPIISDSPKDGGQDKRP